MPPVYMGNTQENKELLKMAQADTLNIISSQREKIWGEEGESQLSEVFRQNTVNKGMVVRQI